MTEHRGARKAQRQKHAITALNPCDNCSYPNTPTASPTSSLEDSSPGADEELGNSIVRTVSSDPQAPCKRSLLGQDCTSSLVEPSGLFQLSAFARYHRKLNPTTGPCRIRSRLFLLAPLS